MRNFVPSVTATPAPYCFLNARRPYLLDFVRIVRRCVLAALQRLSAATSNHVTTCDRVDNGKARQHTRLFVIVGFYRRPRLLRCLT